MQQGLGAKHSGPYTDVSVGTRRVGTAGSHAPSRLCAPGPGAMDARQTGSESAPQPHKTSTQNPRHPVPWDC